MLDNPDVPEFASWRSYQNFSVKVRHSNRYVWPTEVQKFIDTVLAAIKNRDAIVSSSHHFYRAQNGVEFDEEQGDVGYGPARMKPIRQFAQEGRANPSGILVLYLATNIKTAISEVRPWIGEYISVALFKIVRELKLLNLSEGFGQTSWGHLSFDHLASKNEPEPKIRERCVWIDIDNAFSHPINLNDSQLDYVPTQILAELFRSKGYDGIVYRSNFGEEGYNLALFNLDDAEPVSCTPYKVTKMEIDFKSTGNAWFKA